MVREMPIFSTGRWRQLALTCGVMGIGFVTVSADANEVEPRSRIGGEATQARVERATREDAVVKVWLRTSTFVGGRKGSSDGKGHQAEFSFPKGLAVDHNGTLYVADYHNDRIRSVASNGDVRTLAGSEMGYVDGVAAAARFTAPNSVAVNDEGTVFVSEEVGRIRVINPQGRVSTLVLQGPASERASGRDGLKSPRGLAFDAAGNLYVADTGHNRICKVSSSGLLSVVAGGQKGFNDGVGSVARFSSPTDVAFDGRGNLYVTDFWNHRIRKVTPDGRVSTLAGGTQGLKDGTAVAARFSLPEGLAVDKSGHVYVADRGNRCLRMITPAGSVQTLAMSTPNDASARLDWPTDVVVSQDGHIYVTDNIRHCIRKIALPVKT